MNLSMPKIRPYRLKRDRELMSYDSVVQEYGTYFSSYDWQLFGTGTFRNRITVADADRKLKVYFDRLREILKTPVAYIAVPERRTSGCGHPAIPYHWHFVAAAPPQHLTAFTREARLLWLELCGHVHIRRYDNKRNGGFYLAKLAGGADFDYRPYNLERIAYSGPEDLFKRFQKDPYVPEHAKHSMSIKTLALRPHRRWSDSVEQTSFIQNS